VKSKCLVLNEWIFDDLQGTNGKEAQKISFLFLEKLVGKCDHIAVLSGTPWMDKAYKLMKHTDLELRRISRYFHLNILKNPQKCRILNNLDIQALREEIKKQIPEEKDYYLAEIYFSCKADLLITTDKPLYDALIKIDVNIKLREGFLKEYMD